MWASCRLAQLLIYFGAPLLVNIPRKKRAQLFSTKPSDLDPKVTQNVLCSLQMDNILSPAVLMDLSKFGTIEQDASARNSPIKEKRSL